MAALGAMFLVAGFALASLFDPLMTLAQLVVKVDQPLLMRLDQTQRSGAALWLWLHVAVPVLLRPDWLLPTMLGVVCIGFAAQLAWGKRS